jgi:hypothetical protein
MNTYACPSCFQAILALERDSIKTGMREGTGHGREPSKRQRDAQRRIKNQTA